MLVETRPLSSIKPYDRNPRKNDSAVDAVARSLREFGPRQPIVVDEDGVIIVGHTRWKAAQQLGLTEFPVHVAVGLTPEQARAYRIADNQSASISEFDYEILPIEIAALKDAGLDITILGFDDAQLAEILAPPPCPELVNADEVPPPPAEPVTRPGDLWLLGQHRLLCGDSTKPADVDRLMDGQRAALCCTDPPYLVDYTGERVGDSGKDWSADYREIDIPDAVPFFTAVFENVKRVLAPHSAIYCWHAHKRQPEIAGVWRRLGILDHQQIVWVKPTTVFGSVFWHFRHEPCMMGWVQGSKPAHDGSHEFNSVWEVDWEGKARVVGNEHPTTKPVELFARPIRKHTRPGAVCYEPFSGSGSQIIAAERLGRRCYAMEISPVFVDVAVRRWENATGRKAERVAANAPDSETAPDVGAGEAA